MVVDAVQNATVALVTPTRVLQLTPQEGYGCRVGHSGRQQHPTKDENFKTRVRGELALV